MTCEVTTYLCRRIFSFNIILTTTEQIKIHTHTYSWFSKERQFGDKCAEDNWIKQTNKRSTLLFRSAFNVSFESLYLTGDFCASRFNLFFYYNHSNLMQFFSKLACIHDDYCCLFYVSAVKKAVLPQKYVFMFLVFLACSCGFTCSKYIFVRLLFLASIFFNKTPEVFLLVTRALFFPLLPDPLMI